MTQEPHRTPRPPALHGGRARALPGAEAGALAPRTVSEGAILLWSMAVFGTLGAFTGLAVGLVAHAPTAPVAALELGIPATLLGALLVGITLAVRALHRRLTR